MKILMVCLGNICRSPLAEGILREKLRQRGLKWEVDSAGTGAWHTGEPPDRRSVEVARLNGIDITCQRARQIRRSDLEHYDLILAMDRENYENIRRLAGNGQHHDKVRMIMNFAHPKGDVSVPDPYWDDDGFDKVFSMLDRACEGLIRHFEKV